MSKAEQHLVMAMLSFMVLLSALAFALGYMAARPATPWCPTEDSCRLDYRGGAWHVEEVIP